jgi:hypothetical protein
MCASVHASSFGGLIWLADGFVIVVDMLKKIVTEKYSKLHDVCRNPPSVRAVSCLLARTTRTAHAALRIPIELARHTP